VHPILSHKGRLGPYLLAWVPVAGLLAAFLTLGAGLSWLESGALTVPLVVVYPFLCLSSWYVCRALPPHAESYGRLLSTLLLAGAIGSALWVVWATTVASILALLPSFPDLSEKMAVPVFVIFALGFLLYLLVAAFHYVLLSLQKTREQESREAELKSLAQAAELSSLKEQLNPHFLFNSLNSISALTSANPARAREMCLLLADFLRKSLGLSGKSSIPLGDEVALLRAYLAIEKVRFGDRLTLDEETEAAVADFRVPPLLLQPLVENAVKHGIASLTEGGLLRLLTRRGEESVEIVIENSFDQPSVPGLGLGLANVRRRLALAYGPTATLRQGVEDGLFRIVIALPYASRLA